MRTLVTTLFILLPGTALAQATIQSILTALTGSIGSFVAVAVSVALAVFIWGLVRFIVASGDEKAVEEGRQRMVWGIVALFFIISVWGIVALLQNLFGVGPIDGGSNNCLAPVLDMSGGSAVNCL